MKKVTKIFILIILFGLAINFNSLQAQTQQIQLSLIAPVQLVDESHDIRGIRLNLIYGRNTSVTGFDGGFINHSTSGMSTGFQFGFIGLVEGDFTGWQDNSFNITRGNHIGLQAGVFNYANNMEGLQFGLVNCANNLHGVQIGLINIIKQDGAFPVFPIVNWSF